MLQQKNLLNSAFSQMFYKNDNPHFYEMSNYTTGDSDLSIDEILVNYFRAYISPILVIIGIPGNILTIIVFSVMQYQNPCRFNLYPIALSIGHNMGLVSNTLLDDFMGRGLQWATSGELHFSFDSYSSTSCKLMTYVTNAAALVTATILLLFSVDRVYDLYNPGRIKSTGGIMITGLTIALLFACCFLLCSADLVEADRVAIDNATGFACVYVDPVAPGVKFSLYLHVVGAIILPAIFILITNILIVVKLRKMIIARRKTDQDDKQAAVELRKTIALLTLSMFFSFLSFPLIIVIILRQAVHDDPNTSTDLDYGKQVIELSRLFSSVKDLNDVFEFFIYLATIPQFRMTCASLICCSSCCNNGDDNSLKMEDIWSQGSWFISLVKTNMNRNAQNTTKPEGSNYTAHPFESKVSNGNPTGEIIKTTL